MAFIFLWAELNSVALLLSVSELFFFPFLYALNDEASLRYNSGVGVNSLRLWTSSAIYFIVGTLRGSGRSCCDLRLYFFLAGILKN